MCQRGAGAQNTPSVFGTVAIREARAGYTVAKLSSMEFSLTPSLEAHARYTVAKQVGNSH